MRCPRCNNELDSRSERCPNCGLSASLAKPDGDTMSRVRKNISIVKGEITEQSPDELYTSFSPVLKFDKPSNDENIAPDNPAYNFDNEEFHPVEIDKFITNRNNEELSDSDQAEQRHLQLYREIYKLANNKEDDLLAEYYFRDGISDLERYNLEKSYADMINDNDRVEESVSDADFIAQYISEKTGPDEAKENPDSFPEEEGVDRLLELFWERWDKITVGLKALFNDLIHNKIGKYYRKFDAATESWLNKLLDKYYYSKFKKLKRQQSDDISERRNLRKKVWGSALCLFAVAFITTFIIFSSMTDGVTGKWVISYDAGSNPDIIMSFSAGGKAVISVKADDGWHVYKKGKYTTQRKNGHDLLTITYEDGSVSRLYYVIDHKEGTFTNVETNAESVYKLK